MSVAIPPRSVKVPVANASTQPSTGVATKPVNLSGDSIPIVKAASPLLLLPLRIETRFMQSTTKPSHPELWLRIFPDQIAIDTHEDALTEDEWNAAQQYWTQMGTYSSQNVTGQQTSWAQLAASFGPRRAAYVANATQPAGFDAWINGTSATPLGSAVQPSAAFRPSSWSQTPVARALPEVWFVALYDTSPSSPLCVQVTRPNKDLAVALTPQTSPQSGSPPANGIANDMDWLFDFTTALSVGMAVKIPITTAQKVNGFTQVVVVGATGLSPAAARQTLEELLTAHRYTDGFAFVPQGTPTKNSTDAPAGYSRKDDNYLDSFQTERQMPLIDTELAASLGPTDASLTVTNASALPASGTIVVGSEHIAYTTVAGNQLSGLTRNVDGTALASHSAGDRVTTLKPYSDGHFFADALGLDRRVFAHTKYANGLDQQDAINMATVLWPVTGGYFLPYMLGYQLGSTLPALRQFATTVMRARGPVPAFRVGNTPYGVLPVTLAVSSGEELIAGVSNARWTNLLVKALGLWQSAVSPQATASTADAVTASILSQDASTCSINAYLCYGPTLQWNIAQFDLLCPTQALKKLGGEYLANYVNSLSVTLAQIVELGWPAATGLLSGMVIQSLSARNLLLVTPNNVVSETTSLATASNYFQYFPGKSVSELLNNGIQDGQPTLLFRLILQGLLLEYAAVAGKILSTPLSEPEYPLPPSDPQSAGTFLWALLNTQYPGVQSSPQVLGDFIQSQLATAAGPAAYPTLTAIYSSLAALASRPTAALQRAFTETLDIWGYRLDAWWTGLANYRLIAARTPSKLAKSNVPPGVLIGAYGYVELLTPEPALVSLTGATLKTVTAAGLAGPASKLPNPVIAPNDNGGFIYAPSLAHATTGAVLRNGYLNYVKTNQGLQCAIDLSSARVRSALQLMEGINQGQHLGALLGYQFEENLLESNVAMYISPFRQVYPIAANKIASSGTGPATSVAASNVVDGAALQQAWVAGTIQWGMQMQDGSSLPAASGAGYTKVVAALNLLNEAVDAYSDLNVAESVFQIVRGNPARSGGALNASSRDQHAPEPQVIETPRSGFDFTQRLLSVFQPNTANPPGSVWLGTQNATPRAAAEPFLEQWLGAVLPNPASVQFQVTYTAPNAPAAATQTFTLAQAGLSALDLLALTPDTPPLPQPASQGSPSPAPLSGAEITNSQLELWIIAQLAMGSAAPLIPGSTSVSVAYGRTALPAAPLTLPELLPLCRALKDMLGGARPLRPEDLVVGGAQDGLPTTSFGPRLTTAHDGLLALSQALSSAITTPPLNLADALTVLLLTASGFGDPGAAPATIGRDTASVSNLVAQATSVLARIQARITALDINNLTPADLFGKDFVALPTFTPDYSAASTDPLAESLPQAIQAVAAWRAQSPATLLGPAQVLQQMSHVRPAVARADLVMNLSGAIGQIVAASTSTLGSSLPNVDVAQLPYDPNAPVPWLALGLPQVPSATPGQYPWSGQWQGMCALLNWMPNQSGSFVSLANPPTSAGAGNLTTVCGLLFDEWVEKIPSPVEKTAVAMNYEEPESRAPQSLLLAVAPPGTTTWTAQLLVDTVLQAISLAKARTVDYASLPTLGQVLPGLYTAYNSSGLTISTEFSDLSATPTRRFVPPHLAISKTPPKISKVKPKKSKGRPKT